MIAIRGAGSAIARQLVQMLHPNEDFIAIGRREQIPLGCARYLFCAGLLYPKRATEQTAAEIEDSRRVNLWQVTDDIEYIISFNDVARICVIGSESGFAGSFDDTYAQCKRELHAYVERKKLRTPEQQLVCVAPTIIADAGMTLRRSDQTTLHNRKFNHPKRRFLTSREVARFVYFLLYEDLGYTSNVVIRMNGGEHLWR